MKSNKYLWISLGVLTAISGLAYLPLIHKLGYVNDDWYLMYSGYVGGADYFHEIFSVDRPMRGYVMQLAFSLFGLSPLPYHLSAFIFRLLSGLGMLWLCNQLWSRSKLENLIASVLFLVYPGFLSQSNPIDYQSQIISLACGMFSVALTIKAIRSVKPFERWTYMAISILLAWVYLGLVEYFIGFEALRLICVVLLFWRDKEKTISTRLTAAFSAFVPFIAGAGGFLIWRLFFFSAERRATDAGVQLSALFSSPLTALWWLNYLIQDIFKVVVAAWAVPFHSYAFSLRLRESFLGFGLALLGALILAIALRWEGWEKKREETEADTGSGEMREQMWVAFVTIVAGLLPVIMVNRHVVLPDYSRYTLSASVGVAILLSVVFANITKPPVRFVVVSIFVVIALQTHYGNAVRVANETETVNNFWWQVAWRAPNIRPGTTLAASYPVASIQEDYFIWGPANHIYHPEKQAETPIEIGLSAVVLDDDNVSRIIAGRGQESFIRRGDVLVVNDFNNVLVMTQASENSCLRMVSGNMPELSVFDQHRIMLIAPKSNLDNVVTVGESPVPPAPIFGREPPHEWCYYYQRADLARQQGDWNEVAALYEEAVNAGFHPNDQIELMPFLQAYAVLGDQKQVKDLSTRINTHVFYKEQACTFMTRMPEFGFSLVPEIKKQVDELFCQ